ncbi:transcriptional activator RfaH [Candidatus Methylacidiphilum infernorum]|uniref:Transcriptional activator RfaH, NusG family n=1 Tax=Methylacidiphilum infernorum (isolate V4) TaxID=481448 RepID=B3DWJ1_METI4|nr:transcriptional activator RfaH [Candidatus Methylacidiphilum infernorum]ACD82086.1 Transcriptional activator RfaH, NusG family [Methylacidiphilum infernorum V4]
MEKRWSEQSFWYCLSIQPKKEKLAVENLKKENIEVFFPQFQYQKIRSRKTSLVLEPLFPGYLFAKFNLYSKLTFVRSTKGVRKVVHFGSSYPVIPDSFIEELRIQFGEEGIKTIRERIDVGSTINIAEGPFQGYSCIVLGFIPAKERVRVLLEWLGRAVQIEVNLKEIAANGLTLFKKDMEMTDR